LLEILMLQLSRQTRISRRIGAVVMLVVLALTAGTAESEVHHRGARAVDRLVREPQLGRALSSLSG
jgi:hypothetical protein